MSIISGSRVCAWSVSTAFWSAYHFLFHLIKFHLAKPNREHVFHIIFPETWTQTDIINHFRKYGPVQIRWVDSSSAFVALINRENSTILLKTIEKTKNVKVSTFSTYLRVTGADLDDDDVCSRCTQLLEKSAIHRHFIIANLFLYFYLLPISRMKSTKRKVRRCKSDHATIQQIKGGISIWSYWQSY